MKISEVIKEMKQWHLPYVANEERTRDKILAGNPDIECTGIAVTIDATLEVLQKCVEKGINFIISHEGIYYNYEKDAPLEKHENEVLRTKIDFMKEHQLVVWRDHDHMHSSGSKVVERVQEDMIYYGIMKGLGWEEYVVGDKMKPLWYKVPKTTAKELANEIMEKWNLTGLRIVGNIDAEVETVYIVQHLNGGERDLPTIDKAENADVMIPLEICDYTLTQYVRDSATLGKNKVIFEMGHFNAEELGMKHFAEVIKDIVKNQVKVEFIQAGDTFSYLLRK